MRDSNQFFTGNDYQFRLGVYLSNQRRVQEHNQGTSSFKVAMNKLAAYTEAEYKTLLGHIQTSKVGYANGKKATKQDVDAWDWREKGIVNPVKDQGQCGSCWTFSVVQAMESKYAQVKGELLSLSEQNLVDCVTTCYGCNGGDEYIAYDYILQHQDGYWMLETDYPYKGVDGTCKFDKTKGVAKFTSYYRPTTTQDETQLANAVASDGVVSIAIDASHWSFQMYSSGIYDEKRCSSYALDHAVGLVGFGSENGKNYWIVRNSWGPSWGENGYIRMIKDKNNQCGVASDTIIPKIGRAHV